MAQIVKRNRLLPWFIGLAGIIVAVAYTGFRMFFTGCQAPTVVELIVLLVVPGIYLTLMYLTFISQE